MRVHAQVRLRTQIKPDEQVAKLSTLTSIGHLDCSARKEFVFLLQQTIMGQPTEGRIAKASLWRESLNCLEEKALPAD